MEDAIFQLSNGNFIRVKRIDVHYDYVNEDGSSKTDSNGHIDSGNNVESVDAEILKKIPGELIAEVLGEYGKV